MRRPRIQDWWWAIVAALVILALIAYMVWWLIAPALAAWDTRPLVWVAVGVIGFLGWLLMFSGGVVVVVYAFGRVHGENGSRWYGSAVLSLVVLVLGAPSSLVAYVVLMGYLSIFLHPN